jgi:hypothetical protein
MTTWGVYGLIDPADSLVFYVGCSSNPQRRIAQNSHDPGSAAYPQCRRIIERGEKIGHCLFARGLSKEDARILEARLILSIPALTNSKAFHVMPLSEDFERPWLDLTPEMRPRVRHNFSQ